MSEVQAILVPQLNVNDETVLLGAWLVESGASVQPGDPLCEIETSKAAVELEAEHAGVFVADAAPDSNVQVGACIGWIGPGLEAISAFRTREAKSAAPTTDAVRPEGAPLATSRARALAAEHGVSLEEVAAAGSVGTIKEADVQRFLASRSAAPVSAAAAAAETRLPESMLQFVAEDGQLSRHEMAVALNLQEPVRNALLTTLEMEVDLSTINERIRQSQQQGVMVSLLHVVMTALGRSLPDYPRLMSFRNGEQLYRYRQVDVAFVLRSMQGLLYTPVVRELDRKGVSETAQACQIASIRVNRGRIKPEELSGACFTVSHIALDSITRFVALPQRFQSGILSISGERQVLSLQDGTVTTSPVTTLTLTYDHALCDGIYAAEFLQRLRQEMERTFS